MDRAVFERMAEQDQSHWWFLARRSIIARMIERRAHTPKDARVLEIGCGTGHNFGMLGQFGTVDALEIDDTARALASERLGRPVINAPLPALPGIADDSYDLVALLDVLEHIEDDQAALQGIKAKLRPGGRIIVTVPANKWMWSAHDVEHHHFRRYAQGDLETVVAKAGLTVEHVSHFNTVLFPLIALVRLVGKLTGKESADDGQPPAPLNAILRGLFGLERHAAGRVSLPFGVSLIAVLR
jgi:SAM-dependent methyltransferase